MYDQCPNNRTGYTIEMREMWLREKHVIATTNIKHEFIGKNFDKNIISSTNLSSRSKRRMSSIEYYNER